MSAYSGTTLPSYAVVQDERTSRGSLKVSSSMASNVNLLLSSADRTGGYVDVPKLQPWNNFIITKGFNVLQGQFDSVKVSEIRFPWFVPNITSRNNKLFFSVNNGADIYYYRLTIPVGFYTGTTLATALTTELDTDPYNEYAVVECEYNPNGTFTFTTTEPWVVSVSISDQFPNPVLPTSPIDSYKSLAQTMGFGPEQVGELSAVSITGGVASMLYTQYVDICSDVLTQYQSTDDVNTGQLNLRHIICRLYVADETSTLLTDSTGNPVISGETPFIIHRQFKNPKNMKWNGQNSIDRIDIKLFDDIGQPLYMPENTTGYYPNFQITFEASEC
jgi:hypothetical protein